MTLAWSGGGDAAGHALLTPFLETAGFARYGPGFRFMGARPLAPDPVLATDAGIDPTGDED